MTMEINCPEEATVDVDVCKEGNNMKISVSVSMPCGLLNGGGVPSLDFDGLAALVGPNEFFAQTDDTSTMFQDLAKLVPADADGDPVVVVESQGSGVDLTSTLGSRGLWIAAEGLIDFSAAGGNPKTLQASLPTRFSDAYVCMVYEHNTSGSRGSLISDDGDSVGFVLQSGNSSTARIGAAATNATIYIDGVEFTGNRGDLWTTLAVAGKHLVEIWGLDMSDAAWDVVEFGRWDASGFFRTGNFGDLLLLENPGEATRDMIRTLFADKHGI